MQGARIQPGASEPIIQQVRAPFGTGMAVPTLVPAPAPVLPHMLPPQAPVKEALQPNLAPWTEAEDWILAYIFSPDAPGNSGELAAKVMGRSITAMQARWIEHVQPQLSRMPAKNLSLVARRGKEHLTAAINMRQHQGGHPHAAAGPQQATLGWENPYRVINPTPELKALADKHPNLAQDLIMSFANFRSLANQMAAGHATNKATAGQGCPSQGGPSGSSARPRKDPATKKSSAKKARVSGTPSKAPPVSAVPPPAKSPRVSPAAPIAPAPGDSLKRKRSEASLEDAEAGHGTSEGGPPNLSTTADLRPERAGPCALAGAILPLVGLGSGKTAALDPASNETLAPGLSLPVAGAPERNPVGPTGTEALIRAISPIAGGGSGNSSGGGPIRTPAGLSPSPDAWSFGVPEQSSNGGPALLGSNRDRTSSQQSIQGRTSSQPPTQDRGSCPPSNQDPTSGQAFNQDRTAGKPSHQDYKISQLPDQGAGSFHKSTPPARKSNSNRNVLGITKLATAVFKRALSPGGHEPVELGEPETAAARLLTTSHLSQAFRSSPEARPSPVPTVTAQLAVEARSASLASASKSPHPEPTLSATPGNAALVLNQALAPASAGPACEALSESPPAAALGDTKQGPFDSKGWESSGTQDPVQGPAELRGGSPASEASLAMEEDVAMKPGTLDQPHADLGAPPAVETMGNESLLGVTDAEDALPASDPSQEARPETGVTACSVPPETPMLELGKAPNAQDAHVLRAAIAVVVACEGDVSGQTPLQNHPLDSGRTSQEAPNQDAGRDAAAPAAACEASPPVDHPAGDTVNISEGLPLGVVAPVAESPPSAESLQPGPSGPGQSVGGLPEVGALTAGVAQPGGRPSETRAASQPGSPIAAVASGDVEEESLSPAPEPLWKPVAPSPTRLVDERPPEQLPAEAGDQPTAAPSSLPDPNPSSGLQEALLPHQDAGDIGLLDLTAVPALTDDNIQGVTAFFPERAGHVMTHSPPEQPSPNPPVSAPAETACIAVHAQTNSSSPGEPPASASAADDEGSHSLAIPQDAAAEGPSAAAQEAAAAPVDEGTGSPAEVAVPDMDLGLVGTAVEDAVMRKTSPPATEDGPNLGRDGVEEPSSVVLMPSCSPDRSSSLHNPAKPDPATRERASEGCSISSGPASSSDSPPFYLHPQLLGGLSTATNPPTSSSPQPPEPAQAAPSAIPASASCVEEGAAALPDSVLGTAPLALPQDAAMLPPPRGGWNRGGEPGEGPPPPGQLPSGDAVPASAPALSDAGLPKPELPS
eukprot:jgi/Botrbrau1/11497/Bobra.0360s0018.1